MTQQPTMRAVQVHALGHPRDLVLAEIAVPQPGPGEIALDVHAAGVNFPDALMVAGKYQVKPALPFTLGVEVAGVVRALGEGVTGLRVGDRVAALPKGGGFAEVALASAAGAIVLPDALDFVTAAGMLMTYGTAYHGLVDRGRLRSGERLAVTGAGGGVGTAAVDIGRALGARVTAIVGSEAKRAVARAAGADEVVLAAEALPKADLLLDNVGGDVFTAALRALDWQGRALVVGFASGTIPEVAANRVLLKELELIGVYWGTWAEREPARNRANFAAMFELVAAGKLHPTVHARYALADASKAVEDMAERRLAGKAVVTVREPRA
jgi:NADPH2:quinone reductase